MALSISNCLAQRIRIRCVTQLLSTQDGFGNAGIKCNQQDRIRFDFLKELGDNFWIVELIFCKWMKLKT